MIDRVGQDAPQDLAAGVAGQIRHEHPGRGDLESGQLRAGEGPQLLVAGRGNTWVQDEVRANELTELLVGYADHRDFQHGRVLAQHAFDLNGMDVLATSLDPVAQPPDEVDIAVVVHSGQIARVQPAILGDLEQVSTTREDLADLLGIGSRQPQLDAGRGAPDRGEQVRSARQGPLVIGVDQAGDRASLGLPEHVDEADARQRAHRPGERGRTDRRRSVLQEPQAGQRQRVGVQQPLDHRRDEKGMGDAVLAEPGPGLDAEAGKGQDGRPDGDHHGEVTQARDVVEGRARRVDAVRPDAHQARAHAHPRGQPVLPDGDLLRRTRGTGGVQDGGDRIGPGFRHEPAPARVERGQDEQPEPGPQGGGLGLFGELGLGHEQRGVQAVDASGEFPGSQPGPQRRDRALGARSGHDQGQGQGTSGEQRGHRGPGRDTGLVKPFGRGVGQADQLGIGDRPLTGDGGGLAKAPCDNQVRPGPAPAHGSYSIIIKRTRLGDCVAGPYPHARESS